MNTHGDKNAKSVKLGSRNVLGYERTKRVSVRTNTDAFVCMVCQQREKELMQFANPKDYYEAEMRSNYEKAIKYINACHAVINETIMKKMDSFCEKCSSTITNTGSANLSMPLVPNFMSLFNAYRQYNSYESRGTTTEEDPAENISDEAIAFDCPQLEDPQIRPDSRDTPASDNEQFASREETELNNTQTSLEQSVSDISSRDIDDKNAFIPSRDDTEERFKTAGLIAFTKDMEQFKNNLSDFKCNLSDSDAEIMPNTIQQNLNTGHFHAEMEARIIKRTQQKSQGDADDLQTRITDNNIKQKPEPKILKKSTIPLRNGKVGEKSLANKKAIPNKIKIGTEILSQEEVDKYALELLEDNRLKEFPRGSLPSGKKRPPTAV